MVFRITGFTLQRTIKQQSLQGKKLKPGEEIKPGDLAFFAEKGSNINHVGIFLMMRRSFTFTGR